MMQANASLPPGPSPGQYSINPDLSYEWKEEEEIKKKVEEKAERRRMRGKMKKGR